MLKILHTGDLHLDAPFSKLSSIDAKNRKNDLRHAFSSLMNFARKNEIDIILIAGDVFETEYLTKDTIALLQYEFEKTNAKIIIAPGNHDYYQENGIWNSQDVFPSNVYIFKDNKYDKFDFEDINTTVYGYAFTSQELYGWPLRDAKIENSSRFNLVCGHAHINSTLTPYCQITSEQIEAFGADYSAFAHVHNPEKHIEKINNIYYGYSGCIEGRSFNDIGIKGANYIEIDKENGNIIHFKSEFIPFSTKHYEILEVNVTGAETTIDVQKVITSKVDSTIYDENTILQITIVGSISPSLLINVGQIKNQLLFLSNVEIIDQTIPTYNVDQLANDPTIKGEFYRLLLDKLSSEDEHEKELALNALKLGLAALSGEKPSID